MQTVSPKLSDSVASALKEMAGNKNSGAVEAIEGYIFIRRATFNELQGMFSKPEATALVDMYNGTMLTPDMQYHASVLKAKIEDAERYDGSCSRHNANVKDLLTKAGSLTAAQVYILQQELVRAWENNVSGNLAIDKIIVHLSEPDNFL